MFIILGVITAMLGMVLINQGTLRSGQSDIAENQKKMLKMILDNIRSINKE